MAKFKRELKRIIVLTLATLFLLIGLAGLVLPVLQGWLFLALSLILFSMYSPSLRAWIDRHTEKYPRLHSVVGRAQRWTTRVFGAPEV
jgi:uncharacterized membrane protein YbaN (DUF454 family)